jgi:hypothetical protein
MNAGDRRRRATQLGVAGAGLGVVAGLIQAIAGWGIAEWTGAKQAYGALGLLTIGLSILAGAAALRQRRPDLSVLARAACALGLIAPGLLCLTTVGRLWYLPAVLLVAAGGLTVHRWRATLSALAENWTRVLLSVLGVCQLLMVASGSRTLLVVGGLSGVALIVAAWLRSAPIVVVLALVAAGTLPFAALGWTAVVPVLVALLAGLMTALVVCRTRHVH